ncbi:hypothetical protein BS17DRAFT_789032 [Gyrodon lividus]|nr:hypothetical protein BS17DRAFT_789032 [Gyrodon lividus]
MLQFEGAQGPLSMTCRSSVFSFLGPQGELVIAMGSEASAYASNGDLSANFNFSALEQRPLRLRRARQY